MKNKFFPSVFFLHWYVVVLGSVEVLGLLLLKGKKEIRFLKLKSSGKNEQGTRKLKPRISMLFTKL